MVQGIGERIRALRESKGLSQQAVAEALQIKRESINSWENGLRDLKTASIVALADYFGVSTDYLLGRTECKSPDIDVQAICEKTGLSEKAVSTLIELNTNDVIYYDLEEWEEVPEAMFADWKKRREVFFKLTNALLSFPMVQDFIFLCEDIERNVVARRNANAPVSIEIGKYRDSLPEKIKPFLVDPFAYLSYTEYEIYTSLTEISNQMTSTLQQEQGRSDDGETQSS